MATNPFAKYLTGATTSSKTTPSGGSSLYAAYTSPTWKPTATPTKKTAATPTPSPIDKLIKDVTGKSIKLSSVIPTLQPKVKPSPTTVKDIEKLEKKPLIIKPNQTKLNTQQLKQIQGLNDKMNTSATMTNKVKLAGYKRIEARDKEVAQEVKQATRTKLKPGYKEPGIGGSFVESAQQGAAQALSSFGATGEMIGNSTGLLFLSEGGAKIRKKFEKFIASNPELNAPDNLSWKDPRMYSRLAGAAVPSLLGGVIAAIGGTIAAGGNPVGGAASALAYGYTLNAGSTYQEAKASGAGEADALMKGQVTGVINGALDSLTPSKLVKNIPASAKKELTKSVLQLIAKEAKKRGIKILENGTLEGTTEAVQQVVSNAVAQSYDKNRKLWDGLAENFVGGFLGGGGAGTFEGDIKVAKPTLLEDLQDGEKTPDEIIGIVIGSGQENTPEGKELIKSAVEAKNAGQNIMIEKPEAQVTTPSLPKELEGLRVYHGSSDPVGAVKVGSRGFSVTTDPNVANQSYFGGNFLGSKGKVTEFSIKPSAKILTEDNIPQDIIKQFKTAKTDIMESNAEKAAVDFARQNGYDAIDWRWVDKNPSGVTKAGYTESEIKILNPEVLVNNNIYNQAKGVSKKTSDSEADEALLSSPLAEEAEADLARPKVEKAKEEIQKIQEDIQTRRQDNEAKKSILEQFTGEQIKAMRTIKQSMAKREESGKDALTVAETQTYKNEIADVMAAIGTDSTDEAIRFIREDLPSPLVNASSRAELEQIKVFKSHITPKEVEVPRNQLPVGEGERLVSRHAANMKNFIGKANQEQIDELGLSTYNKMNDDKIIAKAAEYVTNNRKEAMDVLLGKKEAPAGLFPEVIYVAMINSKDAKTDMSLATALASLQATALGQRLQILSQIDKNNPIKILNKIYKIIEGDVMARNKGKSIKEIQTKNVKDMNSKVVKPNKGDWFAFVDSLQC